MRSLTRFTVAAALLAASGAVALAQSTTTQPNPLRPASSQKAAPAPAATPQAPAKEEAAKPKRARSPAQLANDNRMRACGKEWRENKAKLAAAGKTWRVYNVECRARMKAAGQ